MRTIVLVSLALASISLTTTVADAGAWCATYRWGGTNCGYSSSDQCHGARYRRILPTESIPRDGLRDVRRQLECAPISKVARALTRS
jgi:hypothetical protein